MSLEDSHSPGPLFEIEPPRPLARRAAQKRVRSSLGDDLARGVCRTLRELGHGTLLEFRVGKGRRVDVMALDKDGRFTIVEVKSSEADFRTDQKWWEYLPYADRFYFAVDRDFPRQILPEDSGLMIADPYGYEIIRPAAEHPLNAARRRAQTVRFAITAGRRLQTAADPQHF